MNDDLPSLRCDESRGCPLLRSLRRSAPRSPGARGQKARHGRVLRPRRIDPARRAVRSGSAPASPRSLLLRGARDRGAPRRNRGEVHRRRGLRRLRRPNGEGGRRASGSPYRGRAAGRRRPARRRAGLAGALAEPRLVTLLGPAGIGKTRLVRELVATAPNVRILVGRCLPYGDGITYWPLIEIVRQAAGLGGEEPVAETRARLAELVAGASDADRIVR